MSINYVIWTKKGYIKITSNYLLWDEMFEKITWIDDRYTCRGVYIFFVPFEKKLPM